MRDNNVKVLYSLSIEKANYNQTPILQDAYDYTCML